MISSKGLPIIMEFIEEDEILPDIYIREFLSIEKMLEYDPTFVQSSYNEIVELITELVKNENSARVFADLHKSIINPAEKILTDYTKFKVDVKRTVHEAVYDKEKNEINTYEIAYKKAHSAAYYNLQQSQKALLSMPFDLENIDDMSNPVLNIESSVILKTNDTSKIIDEDIQHNIRIPVEEIAWQPISVTDETYVVENPSNLESSKFVKWDAKKDPATLDEWITKRINPTVKTTIENHITPMVKNIDKFAALDKKIKKDPAENAENATEFILDTHTIDTKLQHDGYKLEELNEDEFKLLVETLETLDTEYAEFIKKMKDTDKQTKTVDRFPKLSKYILFWDFLGAYKFPNITDEQLIQLRETCGAYMMANNQYNVNEVDIRKTSPYKMAMDILNKIGTLDELLNYIDTYRSLIISNRIKNLLDDSPKTAIEQIDAPTNYSEVIELIKKFKLTEKSIIPENTKPFLNTYSEIAEFVEGNDTAQYDGTPFVATQGNYNEDFEMGLVDDVILTINEQPSLNPEQIMETGEDDAYELIANKYSEKYEEIKSSNKGILEIFATILPKLIRVRDATGMKWSETAINKWIKDINNNDIVKSRMSRGQQIKSQIADISEAVAEKICTSTEQLALARIQQISNSDLRIKLTQIYPSIHKEWMRACSETFISGLAAFWLTSLEASVKGSLGFNILSGMVMFVNTWSPYGVPLEKVSKVGKRGIIYYIDAVTNYVFKTKIDYVDEIQAYVRDHYNERLSNIKLYWEENSSKRVLTTGEQAITSLAELIKFMNKNKKRPRNIIDIFIKSFVYLPLQLPVEDSNKYKKLPAWDLGCCTAKIDVNYAADSDMKTSAKELYNIKIQLARKRWNIDEPRKAYQMFVTKLNKKHTKEGKEGKEDKKANQQAKEKEVQKICNTYFIPHTFDEEINAIPVNTRFDFIFNNTWFPQTHVDTILKDPRTCDMHVQNIISTFIDNRKKANEINNLLQSIKDIGSIINIANLLIKNLYMNTNKYIYKSVYDMIKIAKATDNIHLEFNELVPHADNIRNQIMENAIEFALPMKETLVKLQNTFKGYDYNTALYYAKYILAMIYILPGQVIYSGGETIIDTPDGIDIDVIVKNNYDIMNSWKINYKMPSLSEYNEYINKMREESKNKIMAAYNVLQDDDLQLMKDAKRFGLPVNINTESGDVSNDANDANDANNNGEQDYEQERDFYPENPDMDNANDDERLDRYI